MRFLEFALGSSHPWSGNFRELNAMVTRMATLAPDGRIDLETVRAEIGRSSAAARSSGGDDAELAALLGEDYAEKFDLFELARLKTVVEICRRSKTMAEAGRRLFAVSRRGKSSANDTDRLSKYLARFGLEFRSLARMEP